MATSGEFFSRARFACWLNVACGLAVPDPWLLLGRRGPATWAAVVALAVLCEALTWLHTLSLGAKLLSPDVSAQDRCIGVFTTMTSVKCVAQSLHFLLAKERFRKLVGLWEAAHVTDDDALRELRQAKMVSACIAVTNVSIATCYCLMPVTPGIRDVLGRRNAVPGWFFFDNASSPGFEVSVVFQAVAAAVTVARVTAHDCYFLSLAGLHVAWLRRLGRELGDVIADPGLPRPDVAAGLDAWIRRHQDATEFGSELQGIYSPMWVAQFLCALLILCFTAFVAIAVSLSMMPLLLLVGYTSGNVLQLYLLCYYGDRLQDASELLPKEAFAGPWYSCGPEVQSRLKLVFQRCNKTLRLSAMGVTPLSLETFEAVMKTTVSYFTVLLKLHADG